MHTAHTLSIVLPAFNEESNLKATVEEVQKALGCRFSSHEIIIVDDASTDRTGERADSLASADSSIKVLHNARNSGFGYSYRAGVQSATCEYIGFFPTDNCVPSRCMAFVFDQVGKADIVLNFTSNLEIRPPVRRFLSRLYTRILNLSFGLNLININGPTIHRRDIIQAVDISTDGFAFMAEIMIRLIRSGHSYLEVGTPIRDRKHGKVKAFKIKNILSVLKAVGLLFWDVNLVHRKKYNQFGQAVSNPDGLTQLT